MTRTHLAGCTRVNVGIEWLMRLPSDMRQAARCAVCQRYVGNISGLSARDVVFRECAPMWL